MPVDRVVAMSEADGVAAGALLAARHIRERQQFPLLPGAYEDPDPSSPMARYAPERSSLHLLHGHVVDERADHARTYAACSPNWPSALEQGLTDDVVHVPIGSSSTEAAWVALGFGRVTVVAVRDLAPLSGDLRSDVDVRVATPGELDVVDRPRRRGGGVPCRQPHLPPYRRGVTVEAVRAELAAQLAAPDHAFLITRHSRRDVGILSIGPGIGSPLYVPDGAAYIAATAVVADARRAGVGAVLVSAALAWAAEHGHAAACLHFSTANITSASFWTGVGFTPVMAHLRRRLDGRIRDSRPLT
jgi:GNAT superfamily N-acetyltransferase